MVAVLLRLCSTDCCYRPPLCSLLLKRMGRSAGLWGSRVLQGLVRWSRSFHVSEQKESRGPFLPVVLLIHKYYDKLMPIRLPNSNINLFLGFILMFAAVSLYAALEFMSRENCPPAYDNEILDFLVPRFLSCVKVETQTLGRTAEACNMVS